MINFFTTVWSENKFFRLSSFEYGIFWGDIVNFISKLTPHCEDVLNAHSLIFKRTGNQMKNPFSVLARNTSKMKLFKGRFSSYFLEKTQNVDFERFSRQNETDLELSHFKIKIKTTHVLVKLCRSRTLLKVF